MSPILTRSCSGCAVQIVLTRQTQHQRYCSSACASRARWERPAWKVTRTCAYPPCGAAFLPALKTQRYCNLACAGRASWAKRRAAKAAAP